MAIDYDLARKQLNDSSQPTDDSPVNSYGLSVIANGATPKGSGAEAALSGMDDVSGLIKSNMGRTQQLADKYQKESDPLYADFDRQATSKHADQPQYDDVMSHQELEKSVMQGKQAAKDWGAGVTIVAALLGGVAKHQTLAGLAALKGGLEGLKEGSDDKAKQQIELFKDANASIKQHNDMLNTAYHDILDDRKLSLEDMKQRILEKSLQFNDLLTAQQIQKGDIAGLVSFMKERDKKVASIDTLANQVTDATGNILKMSDVHGGQYIDYLKKSNPGSDSMISEIKAIGDYQQQPRVARAGGKVDPQAEAIMEAVRHYNPEYDQTKWLQKSHYESSQGAALGRSEVPTKIADKAISRLTTLSHLDTLEDAFKKLQTGDVQSANALSQKIGKELGDPKIVSVDTAVSAISNEFLKLYVTSGGTVDERQSQTLNISPKSSPEQMQAAIETMKELMEGQRRATKQVTDQIRGGGNVEDITAAIPANATAPPVPGAKQAPDGRFYVPDPNRPGKYLQVQ